VVVVSSCCSSSSSVVVAGVVPSPVVDPSVGAVAAVIVPPPAVVVASPPPGGGVDVPQIPLSFVGGAILAIGGILIAIGIFSFVVAYGLLKGKSWAWTLTVVLSIISIVVDIIAIVTTGSFFNIISLVISGIILYYLYRPHVKAYFGKGVSPSAPTR
jgi:uncharacterized membrane protein (UPF0136 family)